MPLVKLLDEKDVDSSLKETYRAVKEYFGHVPSLVKALSNNPVFCKSIAEFMIQALRPGRVDWELKELLVLKILRATKSYYGVAHHERIAVELGVSPEKIGDIADGVWRTSPRFAEAEKALLEFTEQVAVDANAVTDELWDKLRRYWRADQLVEINITITTFLMIGRLGDALGVADPVLFLRPITQLIAKHGASPIHEKNKFAA